MAETSCRLKKCGTEEVKGKVLLREVQRDEQNGQLFSEFEVLDLDTGELSKAPFTLIGIGGIASTLTVGSLIYVIGKPVVPLFSGSDNGSGYNNNFNPNVQIHKGMSVFDLTRPEIGWKKAPFIIEDQEFMPNCVSYCGKIYVFRSSHWPCFSEVYDPQLDRWNPLLDSRPPVHENFQVAYPIISDPLNARILIYFFTKDSSNPLSSLCAYYPTPTPHGSGRWECLDENFNGEWRAPKVVVNGVIYFYHRKLKELIEAYDLTTKQWLTVVLSSEFAHSSRLGFYSLHHLGNGVLCLNTYGWKFRKLDPSINKDHTVVYAVKFKVEPRRSHHQVIVTPISFISSPLETCCKIYGYLPL